VVRRVERGSRHRLHKRLAGILPVDPDHVMVAGDRQLLVAVVSGFQEHLRGGIADRAEQRVDRRQRRGVADDHVARRRGLRQREIASQHRRFNRVARLRGLGPARRDSVVQRELDVDGVAGRIRVDQRIAALMHPVAVGEPHPDPHRRVHGTVVQQPTRGEAQPQVWPSVGFDHGFDALERLPHVAQVAPPA
jgi:hypothetical protein